MEVGRAGSYGHLVMLRVMREHELDIDLATVQHQQIRVVPVLEYPDKLKHATKKVVQVFVHIYF